MVSEAQNEAEAMDIFGRLTALQGVNRMLGDSLAEVWNYIFDNKNYAYGYILDELGREEILSREEEAWLGAFTKAGERTVPMSYGVAVGEKIVVTEGPLKGHEAMIADVKAKIEKLLSVKGKHTVDEIHKKLGHIMWEYVGMARNEAGLKKAIELIQELRKEFWSDVYVAGDKDNFNQELEKALRLADFLEIGELMARDALHRRESCGGHFREEMQTEDGETKRDDENFMYVGAWEYKGDNVEPELHKEPLVYENIKIATRNYKD